MRSCTGRAIRSHARYGSQFPTPDHAAIAKVLGVPMEKVALKTILAGGSFGRRAQQTVHVAAELAEVAKAIGPGKADQAGVDPRGRHARRLLPAVQRAPHARRGA